MPTKGVNIALDFEVVNQEGQRENHKALWKCLTRYKKRQLLRGTKNEGHNTKQGLDHKEVVSSEISTIIKYTRIKKVQTYLKDYMCEQIRGR